METPALAEEKRKLRKSLFRFDMVFFTVCAIIAIDTLGQASSFGAQSVFWVVVSAVTFLLPYGLVVSELGTAFPVEGATYEWVRLAYGRLAGAMAAMLYWAATPIWVGGTLSATAIAAMDALWGTAVAENAGLEILVAAVFIWLAVVANILSLRQMKWVPNYGGMVKVGLLGLFTLLVVVMGIRNGFAGSMTDGFFPSNLAVFVGVIGVVVFQWVGFELQTNASEEMENPQRDIPRAVLRSGVIVALAYAVPIAAIVLTVSSKDLGSVTGFVSGYRSVVTGIFGGAATLVNVVVGAAVVFALLSSATTWLMGSDRAIAISSLAGSGPRRFGHFSQRFGTPVTVNVVSGVMATAAMLGAFLVTGGNLGAFFAVLLSVVISTSTFCYLPVFPALLTLRRKYARRARPYRLPGGALAAWIAVGLCEVYVALAAVFSLWPGICDTSTCFGSSALEPVSGLGRGTFELTALSALTFVLLVAVVFWLVGRSQATSEGSVEGARPAGAEA